MGLPHVAGDEGAVSLADFGDRLAGFEMDDFVVFEGFVRFAPADDGDAKHGRRLVGWRVELAGEIELVFVTGLLAKALALFVTGHFWPSLAAIRRQDRFFVFLL